MILRWNIVIWLLFSYSVQGLPSSDSSHAYLRFPTVSPTSIFRQTGILPKEHQVSVHLNNGEIKRVTLVSERAGFPLSIAATPCSSSISWNVYFGPLNHSISSETGNLLLLKEFASSNLETYKTSSSKIGQYVLEIKTLENPTTVQLFASEEPVPPHGVRMAQHSRMRLQRRQRRKRITVKWDQSPIDPHVTEYCLVVNSKKNYTSLCSAQEETSEKLIQIPQTSKRGSARRGKKNYIGTSKMSDEPGKDLLINCIGSRTHHTIDNLIHGQTYYFNVFAVNKQTNLTFPYGSTVFEYDKRVKHSILKDGKPASVNLKKLDGKAVFKFKAGNQTGDNMLVSIMPCGGAVDVEILLKGQIILKKRGIDSYERLLVPSVKKGQRYFITVLTANREELRRTSAVEVLATTKEKFPLPQLPSETEVREYDSLKECDSVTVGWLPSPDPTAKRYCVVARESKRRDTEGRAPDQCGLETRLKKSTDYQLMHCQEFKAPRDGNKVMTQKVTGLKPGRRYVVQVTVKKSFGKTLSYDLLTVHTKSNCA